MSSKPNNSDQRPDIIFAYANVFGFYHNDKFEPLPDSQILSPDKMFNHIVQAAQKSNRKLLIEKKTLDEDSFQDILHANPRVLFIMCHGQLETKGKQNQAYFWFESKDNPFVLDKFSEERLLSIVENIKVDIDVIVLSTCHSQ